MIDRDTVRQATVTIEGDDLGPSINTADVDFCPMVTPDGRYLFFSRRYGDGGWETATDADVFWVDIDAVKRLRK